MKSFLGYEIWDIICKHSIGWAGHSFYSVQPSFLNPNTSLKRTRPHKLICWGKWKHRKLPKAVFLELLHPKNFIRKPIVGTIAKDIVQGIIWGAKPWRYKGISTKRWKKSKKTKEHFSKPKPYSAMKYQKGKTIAVFRHSWLKKKKIWLWIHELRMLSRPLSECQSLTLNVMMRVSQFVKNSQPCH